MSPILYITAWMLGGTCLFGWLFLKHSRLFTLFTALIVFGVCFVTWVGMDELPNDPEVASKGIGVWAIGATVFAYAGSLFGGPVLLGVAGRIVLRWRCISKSRERAIENEGRVKDVG